MSSTSEIGCPITPTADAVNKFIVDAANDYSLCVGCDRRRILWGFVDATTEEDNDALHALVMIRTRAVKLRYNFNRLSNLDKARTRCRTQI
jgi:hypothetical protein